MATSKIEYTNKPRELWSGTWSSGSITVPDTDKYTIFIIVQSGSPIIAFRQGSGIVGMSISGSTEQGNFNQYNRAFRASISGNTWTLQWAKQLSHVATSPYHGSGVEQTITLIRGII